jgi:glutamine amidotransferase
MNVVGIIEYGAGNLDSVARAVEYCGGTPLVTQSPKDLRSANRLILPGVGSFAAGMQNLRGRGYEEELHEQVIVKKIPFLGICLGMQFLASLGMEPVATSGLGWIDGRVIRLKSALPGEKVPHMGWNSVAQVKASPLFSGIQPDKDFYFVHSYHFEVANVADVITTTSYCGGFVSSVSRDNIFGVQFHPEKSQRVGFQLLKNFLAM